MPIQTAIDSISNSQGSPFGFKNRIINGAMVIDQRNAGASVTQNDTGIYTLDRWTAYGVVTSKFAVRQNVNSVTPPPGFKNYLGCTSSSAYSVTSGDLYIIQQNIEGYNVADLAWGTASASTVTLSFWVRSSLTGTFGGSLTGGNSRNYPWSYTISSANTWEYKTITIPGDTSGTWGSTNGTGVIVNWSLGTGSTYSVAAGSWTATSAYSVPGATSVVGTNGATLYITGVQFEKGSQATSFDYRDYGRELQLCQRYCYVLRPADGGATYVGGVNGAGATATGLVSIPFPVTMRAAPTLSLSGSSFYVDNFSLAGSCTIANTNLNQSHPNVGRIYFTSITVAGGSFSLSQAMNFILGLASTTGILIFGSEL